MWKEYVQPILFSFTDAPLYPNKLPSYEVLKKLRTHWAEMQDWLYGKLGYTFAVNTPLNVAGELIQEDYVKQGAQWHIYKELYLRNIVDLPNPKIAYYVHTWGPVMDMKDIGTYDGKVWGYDTDAGRCMDAPINLLDICISPYWEVVANAQGGMSCDLAKGRNLHELLHGIAALPDYDDTTVQQIMWEWWKFPNVGFTDSEKVKAMRSRWMWVK